MENSSSSARKISIIASEFNDKLRELIIRLERKVRKEEDIINIDRLKKRISLLKSMMGDTALLSESAQFFIDYSEKILSRAHYEKFILELNPRAEYLKYNQNVRSSDEFAFPLIDSVKSHYIQSSPKEKDDVYEDIKYLLQRCIEYHIALLD